ncbi:unnamed protein product [Symbiodinium sp. CCMP2592]|nr:unnamed protein product [Symbiodinium sp. CCMP2592]
MPLTTKKLCGDRDHQVISPVDYVRELAANNKLENLTGGEPLKSTLRDFWERFQYLRPDHPALAHGVEACACSVPILLFGDEGRALKKQAAMVLGWEPMLGFGCMTHCTDDPESHHGHKLNFDGSTYKTRMLYTIMHKKTYGSKKSGNKYLMSLVDCWASDHAEAMQGVVVQHGPETIRVHLIPVGIKCDWPALVKLGQIKRSFYCDAVPHGKGICHLCMANTAACPDYSGDGWKETMQHSEAFTAPWDAVPALVSQLCPGLDEWQQAAFYRLDLFHICHKGVMAELAGSGLVTLLHMRLYPARGSFEDRLGLVYEDLKSFAKSEKLTLHMSGLTRTLVRFPENDTYPSGYLGAWLKHGQQFSSCMTWFKGADTTVVLKFLASFLQANLGPDSDDYLKCLLQCCQAGNKFLSILYHNELWLPSAAARKVVKHGNMFVYTYKRLASMAYARAMTRYLLIPKHHLFKHIVLTLEEQLKQKGPILNPLCDSCQMCEDFINKISTLGRSVSQQKFCEATLLQYMLCVQRNW